MSGPTEKRYGNSEDGSEIEKQCNAISECINRKIKDKKKEQAISELQRFDV